MVLEIIIILTLVIVAALVVNNIEDYLKTKNKISFKESMDLAELPVITFYQENEKFNFLLDTGSNDSHICAEAAKRIKGTSQPEARSIQGIGGETLIENSIDTTINYKAQKYKINLLIGEHLNEAFRAIKETTGVQVHGLIGNRFLSDNKYTLDFKELVAYSKN